MRHFFFKASVPPRKPLDLKNVYRSVKFETFPPSKNFPLKAAAFVLSSSALIEHAFSDGESKILFPKITLEKSISILKRKPARLFPFQQTWKLLTKLENCQKRIPETHFNKLNNSFNLSLFYQVKTSNSIFRYILCIFVFFFYSRTLFFIWILFRGRKNLLIAKKL